MSNTFGGLMKFFDVNPYIRFFWTRKVGSDYSEELLAYDFRLIYGLKGIFMLESEGKSFEIGAGTFAVIPPATPYLLKRHSEVEDDHLFCIFNFDMNCRRSDQKLPLTPQSAQNFNKELVISTDTPPETQTTVILEGDHRTDEIIKEITHLFSTRPLLYREECGALLKQLLTHAVRKGMEDDNSEPRILNEILTYIREHYKEPITNASIAQQFKYHPNHINRIFKKHMDTSLHNYVIHYRLKRAKELLVGTDLKIDVIARETGFMSPSYFSKYFRLTFGESPLEYRTEYIKKMT
jgi:AraC-like DNA-binding protein